MEKLDTPYKAMINLLDGGMEYPEAHTQICVKHDLSEEEGKTLTEWYDNDNAEVGNYA